MSWYFIDRIIDIEVGKRARGLKVFSIGEEFFQEHFPKYPIVPGVIVLESLAQLSGKLIGYSVYKERGFWPFPIVTMMQDVKFRRFLSPGDTIETYSEIENMREESCEVKVRALSLEKVVVEARMFFIFNPKGLDSEEAQKMVEMNEKRHLKKLWKEEIE